MKQFYLPLLVLFTFNLSPKALAHGVKIETQVIQAIEIKATYNSGEPMKQGQVTIYAPDDRGTPWLEGSTDDQGQFIFTPDLTKSGNWDIKVRQAGHGNLITIPIDTTVTTHTPAIRSQQSVTGYTPLQTGVMIASVIWGCLGTALYFSQKKAITPNPELTKHQ